MLLFIFLLVHELRLSVCIWSSIWNSTWGNEAWYRCPWRNIRLVKLEYWSCFEHAVACMNKPCRVVLQLYVYVKLSILDSCFRLILYLLYMQLEFRRYVMLCHRSFTEIEYSIPFIHGSLGALLLFCFAKQRENNEALNSE